MLQRFPCWKRGGVQKRYDIGPWGHGKLSDVQERDKSAAWSNFRSNLKRVERRLGFKINRHIAKSVAGSRPGTVFKVFDAGCGAGTALADLKAKFRGKVRTVGLVFEKSPGEKYLGVDRLLEGDINSIEAHEQFDLIFSHAGAAYHSPRRLAALKRIIHWLKDGGTAVMQIGDYYGPDKKANVGFVDNVATIMAQNGIRDFSFRKLSSGHGYGRKHNFVVLQFRKPQTRLS